VPECLLRPAASNMQPASLQLVQLLLLLLLLVQQECYSL
jgi:hypothetical protein